MVVQPSIAHFGGFRLNQSHRLTVRILNQSAARIRVTISPPLTPEFKIHQHKKVSLRVRGRRKDSFDTRSTPPPQKKGFFVPGMYEELDIEFTPTEWRYHQDVLRIRSSDGTMVSMPLHGYPTMNDVIFPRKIDFLSCGLAEK